MPARFLGQIAIVHILVAFIFHRHGGVAAVRAEGDRMPRPCPQAPEVGPGPGVPDVDVAVLASGFRLRRESPRTEVGAGFVSGMINTSIGVGGPPVVIVLQAAEHEQHAFRATTVSYFLVSNLIALPLFFASGVVADSTWAAGLVAVPAALVGTLAFERVAYRVRTEQFRVLVLGLLVGAAVVSLAQVLW